MKDPTRLLDDPELAADLRSDLETWVDVSHQYSAQAKLTGFRDALKEAGPSGPASATAQQPSRFAWPKWQAPWVWKVAVLVAVGGGGIALVSVPPLAAVVEPRQSMPAVAAAPVVERTWPPAAPAQVAPVPETAEPVAMVPVVLPRTPKVRPADRAGQREIAYVVRLRAMVERDPVEAARLAQRIEQEFPDGALSEEREALQALALFASGETDQARRRARGLLARHPQTVMRARLQAVLGP